MSHLIWRLCLTCSWRPGSGAAPRSSWSSSGPWSWSQWWWWQWWWSLGGQVMSGSLPHSFVSTGMAVASPVRLATLGLSAVHSLLSTAQHYTLLYTRSHRTASFFWQQFKRLLSFLKEGPLNNKLQILNYESLHIFVDIHLEFLEWTL